MYLLTDDDPPRPYGVALALSMSRRHGPHLQIGWNLPHEPDASDETPEAAQLRTEEHGLPWPPFLNVYPDDTSA